MLVKHHSMCFNLSQARVRVSVPGGQCRQVTTPHPHHPLSSLLQGRLETSSPLLFLLHRSRPTWAHLGIAFSYSTTSKQVEIMHHSICSKSPSLAADPISSLWYALQSRCPPTFLFSSHSPSIWGWPDALRGSGIHVYGVVLELWLGTGLGQANYSCWLSKIFLS